MILHSSSGELYGTSHPARTLLHLHVEIARSSAAQGGSWRSGVSKEGGPRNEIRLP